MNNDDLAAQLMEDIDPRFLEFIRSRVTSFVAWDLVRFFHDNPHTTDTAQGIARYIGRDVRVVEPELKQLATSGILEADKLEDMIVYTLIPDVEIRALIDNFIQACYNRQFRIKALYHVIQGIR